MKKGIIILTVLSIIVAIVLIVLFVQKGNIENKLQQNTTVSEIENPSEKEEINQLEVVSVRSEFLLVENCIKTFYQNYAAINSSGEQLELSLIHI